ncbi:MAG: VOC family protein [Deferribacterales bacterium]
MKVNKLTNILISENVVKTTEFYMENFGFKLLLTVPEGSDEAVFSFESGVEYCFCIITNDSVNLMIQTADSIQSESSMKPEDIRKGSSMMYLEVADLDGLFDKLHGKAEIVKGLHETFYGMKEFYIKDPDGNTLGLAEKA